MLFNNSKYTNTYFNLVNKRKNEPVQDGVYSERHHIVPRSLGGDDIPENIVIVTGREHFILHLLLTKMTSGEDQIKMIHAYDFFYKTAVDHREFTATPGILYHNNRERLIENLKKKLSTDEAKAERSRISKERWEDPERLESMRQKQIELRNRPEAKARAAEILRERNKDPKFQKAIRDSLQKRMSQPDWKEKQKEQFAKSKEVRAQKMKALWADPEWRESIIRKRKEAAARKAAEFQKTGNIPLK